MEPQDIYETYGLTDRVEKVAQHECMRETSAVLRNFWGVNYTCNNMFAKEAEFVLCYSIPEFDKGCEMADPSIVPCAGPSFPRLQYDYDDLACSADINSASLVEDLKGFPLEELKERKEQGDTIIYCSMGTTASQLNYVNTAPLFHTLADAYGEKQGTTVVLGVGSVPEQELPTMPCNFMWQRSVPQKTILGNCTNPHSREFVAETYHM